MKRPVGTLGFSLIELLISLALSTIVAGTLLALLVGQLDFYQQDAVLRDARGGARGALNVMLTDLRMVEGGGRRCDGGIAGHYGACPLSARGRLRVDCRVHGRQSLPRRFSYGGNRRLFRVVDT
jgi:prepilin-type N-terminal cleavage/methylation domain-containing protein